MNARRIMQREFGGPDTLAVEGFDPPTADSIPPGDVLVRVAAVGVNPIDAMTRKGGGMAASGVIALPYTPGWDVAGQIAALGPEVENLHVGERVFGLARFPVAGQTYADYATVPAVDLMPTPENLTDQEAGALPMAAMTALQAFGDTATVTSGQRVLITGAGGGVGHVAVQIARHLGATVIAIASQSKHEWLHQLGADVTIDYRAPDQVAALSGDPVDVALSLAAGSREASLQAVKRGGTLISLGAGSDALAQRAAEAGITFAATHVHTQRVWIEQVASLASSGAVKPTISEVFDLTQAGDAHRAVESGHSTGKVILRT